MSADQTAVPDPWVLEVASLLGESSTDVGASEPTIPDLARDWASFQPPVHRQDWAWIRAELQHVRKCLGVHTAKILKAYMASVDAAAARGAAATKWDPKVGTDPLRLLRRRSNRLRQRAMQMDALEAAWQDLLDAAADPTTPPHTLRWRRDLLAAMVMAQGISWTDRGALVRGVLTDRLWDVKRAQSLLGKPHPELQASDLDVPSGLDLPTRLALSLELLQCPDSPAQHVVWLAFDNARIDIFPSLNVGPIRFYWAGWLRDKLANDSSGLPAELDPSSPFVRPDAIPDLQDGVMARVEVPGSVTQPVEWATQYARSVVSLARFSASLAGERVWTPLQGMLHARNGSIYSTSTFREPFDPRVGRDVFFAPSAALAKMAKPITRVAPSDVEDAAIGVGWLESAIAAEPAAAVLIATRVVEMVADRAGLRRWYEYLNRYFAGAWVEAEIKGELAHYVRYAVRGRYGAAEGVDEEHQVRLGQIARKVIRSEDGVGYVIGLVPALKSLRELTDIYSESTSLGRTLRWLQAHLATSSSLDRWCEELALDWERSWLRARWVRNRVAHGPGASATVSASASKFAVQMAGWSMQIVIQALNQGRSSKAASLQLMKKSQRWRVRLAAARDVAHVLRS